MHFTGAARATGLAAAGLAGPYVKGGTPGGDVEAVGHDVDRNPPARDGADVPGGGVADRGDDHAPPAPPEQRVEDAVERARQRVPHAVHGDHHRQARAYGGTYPHPGERRNGPGVDVHHIGTPGGHQPEQVPAPARVDGQVEGQAGDDAVDPGDALAGGRGGHLDLVTGLGLRPHQIGHLHLDAAEPWQVTVTDVKDPHPASLAEPATRFKRDHLPRATGS